MRHTSNIANPSPELLESILRLCYFLCLELGLFVCEKERTEHREEVPTTAPCTFSLDPNFLDIPHVVFNLHLRHHHAVPAISLSMVVVPFF